MSKRPSLEVLVVEDEPITRMGAADALSDVGVRIREAGDASEALQLLHDHPKVDLLFTDIDLPGEINGLVLAERVHNDRPDVELIVTSGAQVVADADLPDHGTFIAKPYRTNHLIQIVKQKLGY